jgi:membrane glycosyltransferase
VSDIAIRRWVYLFLVLTTTAIAAVQFWSVLRIDGLDPVEYIVLLLFAILFGWISVSFWIACFGVYFYRSGIDLLPLRKNEIPSGPPPRTAILMPVYNEDTSRVFAGVRAICESVLEADGAGFDYFILSDSTNPAHWIAEEVAWHALSAAMRGRANIFYRHRPENKGRKSGNIQDFCENWGALYDYMVILDADSLMTGATLKRLVRLMNGNPRTALIQVPARLVGRQSLFARIQQFASSAYGQMFNDGLAALQGPDGNYWGHNAIIRIRPFFHHGGLPKLPGKPPLGGEIMSHDFVEAALLRRAGWEVWMASDLGGSYEEPPPTIYDHLKRDRRWCQGNLQHMRVVLAQGLKTPNRLHLTMGIMSYVSSPLWLLLLLVSAFYMIDFRAAAIVSYAGRYPVLSWPVSHAFELLQLVFATAILLYMPKIFALLIMWRDKERLRAHGGFGPALLGVLGESVFATLLAPIVMLSHSWFVLNILLGLSTGWGPQQRNDRALPFGFVVRRYGPHTVIALGAGAILWRMAPTGFGWFVPLLLGPVLSIPLAYFTSSPRVGRFFRRIRLFLVPSETQGLAILNRTHALVKETGGMDENFHRRVLDDTQIRDLHLSLLKQMVPQPARDPQRLDRLMAAIRKRDTAALSNRDWMVLLSDADSLRALADDFGPGSDREGCPTAAR